MSWTSIVLAIFGAGFLFSYIGFSLESKKWLFLKLFFFLVGVFLSFLLVFLTWIIGNNPDAVGSFAPVGLGLLMGFGVLFLAFILLFVVILVRNYGEFAVSMINGRGGG